MPDFTGMEGADHSYLPGRKASCGLSRE
ncbi:hypothetical protein LINPERPRIM_LOCUS31541 [Linum perenne]